MRRSAGIPFYVIPALLTILLTAGLSSVWFICPRGPSPYEIYRDSLDFTPPVPLAFLPDSLTDENLDRFFDFPAELQYPFQRKGRTIRIGLRKT